MSSIYVDCNTPGIPDRKNSTLNTIKIEDQPVFKAKKWPQYYASLSAQIGGFSLGTIWFWTATALPDLANSGELGEVTKNDRAWLTSILQLGALCICPLTGYCMSRFGRRTSMLWSNIPFALGCILIGLAPSVSIIYIGRFILGATLGIYAQIIPIFVAEVAEVDIRGRLMCLFEIMICLGTVFIYVIGAYTSWRMQSLICGIAPIIGFVLLFFVPESPYYYMEQEKDKEAGKALCWLRGAESTEQVSKELLEITDCVRRKLGEKNQAGWRVLKDYSILKPIVLCMGLMTFFQGSFINVIMAAAVEIFQSAGSVDEYMSTIVLGIVQTIATTIPMLIADKFGRKVLFMVSLSLLVFSLTSLGFYFHFKDHFGEESVQNVQWIPLASLTLYVIATSIGIVPLSWVVMGEIIPPRAKGLAVTLITIWNRIVAFFVIYIFWDMLLIFGNDGTYWIIASVSIVAAIFIFICIPETKGKTLDEIQLLFVKSSSSDTTKL